MKALTLKTLDLFNRLADSIRPKNEQERREYGRTAMIIAFLATVALIVYSYLT